MPGENSTFQAWYHATGAGTDSTTPHFTRGFELTFR